MTARPGTSYFHAQHECIVDTFFKNAITCNNDNNNNYNNNLHAGALIQQDQNLISIDGSMHIKIASISWQGWKIETREPEMMKLI